MDAYRFESGMLSLTRQVQALGLDVLVVDRDGRGYRPDEWASSDTFRQNGQKNLLIADNQTDSFAASNETEQEALCRRAWGRALKK
jgi:hypothetical protein